MLLLKNANVITPDEVLEGYCVAIENGKIAAIEKELSNSNANIIDCKGSYLMAGIIDIHSDMIENLLQPRSTALFDYQMGLDEAEKQLCTCGITTIYHSVSMYRKGSWDDREIRSAESVQRLSSLIKRKKSGRHLINNKYHLRYELDNVECYENVIMLLENGYVDLLSIMDHRPGQGQYRNLSIYRKHLPNEGRNLTDEEFSELVRREKTKPMIEGEKLTALVSKAKGLGIPVSSHDDDTISCIERNAAMNIDISEFPITMEVCYEAKQRGLATLLGAPNILLGGSHSGNLSAETAIKSGCGDILCSDYYPQALLRAVFYLADKKVIGLEKAANLVTFNPAKALGLEHTGAIKEGFDADLIIVRRGRDNAPVLEKVFVGGKLSMALDYGEETK